MIPQIAVRPMRALEICAFGQDLANRRDRLLRPYLNTNTDDERSADL